MGMGIGFGCARVQYVRVSHCLRICAFRAWSWCERCHTSTLALGRTSSSRSPVASLWPA